MAKINLSEWLNAFEGLHWGELGFSEPMRAEDTMLLTHNSGGQIILMNSEQTVAAPEDVSRILVADDASNLKSNGFFAVLAPGASVPQLSSTLKSAAEFSRLKQGESHNQQTIQRHDYVLRELLEIGKSLNSFQSLETLLSNILQKSRQMIGADAGSIYVVEGNDKPIEQRRLHFKLVQNDSIACHTEEFSMPVSMASIAGAATVMKRSVNIPNVRDFPKDVPYQFDHSWDERTGYRTISVLAVPMTNQEGTVMGVIQLINKKKNPSMKLVTPADFEKEVIPMDPAGCDLIETLASQAGIAMENARLYAEIKHIFSGFVKASVHAIEQRDPTTSGHSFRVAALTRELARVVTAQKTGRFKDVQFTEDEIHEIETAALLHDFGKVGVREEVLVKAKKLYPQNREIIRARIDFIRTSIENDHLQRRLAMLEEGAPSEELAILDDARRRAVSDIDECWRIINAANEPTVLNEGDFAKVEEVAGRTFFDLNGKRRHYLESDEVKALLVAKGSLTAEELEEIRSHAAHTISFLERIPWGVAMKNIPKYAGCHHEKLDGSGYPNRLTDKDIPLPSKIMAVADIYDALTAADRPYKKAVPVEKAFQILDFEAKDNHIDADLVALFKQYEVYKVIEGKQPSELIEQ
ncbi:MAG: GAF domain-containing protein [Deltaproteobacteria bacterium]|nr:GAF domain-containing protein [Deltaproteobacteria bacterium]